MKTHRNTREYGLVREMRAGLPSSTMQQNTLVIKRFFWLNSDPCLVWGKPSTYLQDWLVTPFIAGCVSGFHCKPCIWVLIAQLYKFDLDFKTGMCVLDLEANIEAGWLICWLCE